MPINQKSKTRTIDLHFDPTFFLFFSNFVEKKRKNKGAYTLFLGKRSPCSSYARDTHPLFDRYSLPSFSPSSPPPPVIETEFRWNGRGYGCFTMPPPLREGKVGVLKLLDVAL